MLESREQIAARLSAERGATLVPSYDDPDIIAGQGTVGLEIADDAITFTARFSGVSYPIRVPVGAVLVIHARETGQGMALPEEPYPGEEAEDDLAESALEGEAPADADTGPGDGDLAGRAHEVARVCAPAR